MRERVPIGGWDADGAWRKLQRLSELLTLSGVAIVT